MNTSMSEQCKPLKGYCCATKEYLSTFRYCNLSKSLHWFKAGLVGILLPLTDRI